MWGTGGIRTETVDDSRVWVFSAADHFDARRAGVHAAKTGNRFAALRPVARGLKTMFGTTGAGAGRDPALRMDRSTQYTAGDFLGQVKFWGIAPSFASVAEPRINGVAERFNGTLEEQVFHGRVSANNEAVRVAVAEFKERYNRHWRFEKTSFMYPPGLCLAKGVQKRVQTIGAGTDKCGAFLGVRSLSSLFESVAAGGKRCWGGSAGRGPEAGFPARRPIRAARLPLPCRACSAPRP